MEPMPCSLTNIMKGGNKAESVMRKNIPNHLRELVYHYQIALQKLQLTILEYVDHDNYLNDIGKGFEELENQVERMIQKMV